MVELISVHVPKTAGTAFRHILLEVYGSQGVLEDYPPDRIYQPDELIDQQIKVIHGHFLSNKYDEYFPQAKKIIWLRHPIFRLISEYFFAKTIQDRNNVIHVQLLDHNLDVLEFAEIPQMRNFLSQKIADSNLNKFDFIGIQEFYLEDLEELKQMMGWQNFQPTIKNSNRYPDYHKCLQEILADQVLMNRLAKLNRDDLKLYQEALNLRAKRRNESILIQSTLADWQRSQFLREQLQIELQQANLELQQIRYWLKQTKTSTHSLELITTPKTAIANLIAGFHFDLPHSPISTTNHLITINGWVIGKTSPATKIIITANNQIINEAPVTLPRPDVAQVYPIFEAKNSGFETHLVIDGIPANIQLQIQVVLADLTQVNLATLAPLFSY
jgi:hypothetical protein